MLRPLYFRIELTIPSSIWITVLQTLSGCDDESILDGLTQTSVPKNVSSVGTGFSALCCYIFCLELVCCECEGTAVPLH